MKKKLFIVTTACLFAIATIAQASSPTIRKVQENQRARIQQGINSGELTKHEALRLKKLQAKIQHDKMVAKSDGVITPAERSLIKKQTQASASREIYKQKHDAQRRN